MAYLGFQQGGSEAPYTRQEEWDVVTVVEGLGPSPEKYFAPNFFLQTENANTSDALGHGFLWFNRETELTQTLQKLSKNSRSEQGGSRAIAAPKYATA